METTNKLILNYNDIPVMPNVMVKALNVIKDEGSGLNDLADVMCYDQALTTQVLRLVNSAYYGFAQQITSINKALPLIGMDQAKNIIITFAMKPMLTSRGGKDMWEHSIRSAVACEYLAKEFKVMDSSDAFVIGFLHDIGKIVLNMKNQMVYKKVIDLVNRGANILEVENMFFGTNHCDVGFLLAKKWQLPVVVNNGIKYHHNPQASSMANFAYIVYIADKLAQARDEDVVFDENMLKDSNIKLDDVQAYRETIITKAGILLTSLAR